MSLIPSTHYRDAILECLGQRNQYQLLAAWEEWRIYDLARYRGSSEK